MNNQQQAIEAAHLARMVGSHLHGVDSMFTERNNHQANKINMQKFVAPILGQQVSQSNEMPVDPRMAKAVRDAELLAMQQVPDTTVGSQVMSVPLPPTGAVNLPYIAPISVPQQQAELVSKEDLLAIRSQLERTNATLTKMAGMLGKVFASFTEKSKDNQPD